jgi:hypothetical protein
MCVASGMPFVDLAQGPVNCANSAGRVRSISSRIWHGQHAPGPRVSALAKAAAARVLGLVGRVQSLGAFEDIEIERDLRDGLPELLASFARPRLEWYGCRGAFFHNDAHYDGVLFGIWSILGPARDVVFPRIDYRVSSTIGSMVVFDPFEPHGVLVAGALSYRADDYEGAEPSVFLGFEIALGNEVRDAFAIAPAQERGPTLSSRIAINPENGDFTSASA